MLSLFFTLLPSLLSTPSPFGLVCPSGKGVCETVMACMRARKKKKKKHRPGTVPVLFGSLATTPGPRPTSHHDTSELQPGDRPAESAADCRCSCRCSCAAVRRHSRRLLAGQQQQQQHQQHPAGSDVWRAESSRVEQSRVVHTRQRPAVNQMRCPFLSSQGAQPSSDFRSGLFPSRSPLGCCGRLIRVAAEQPTLEGRGGPKAAQPLGNGRRLHQHHQEILASASSALARSLTQSLTCPPPSSSISHPRRLRSKRHATRSLDIYRPTPSPSPSFSLSLSPPSSPGCRRPLALSLVFLLPLPVPPELLPACFLPCGLVLEAATLSTSPWRSLTLSSLPEPRPTTNTIRSDPTAPRRRAPPHRDQT